MRYTLELHVDELDDKVVEAIRTLFSDKWIRITVSEIIETDDSQGNVQKQDDSTGSSE